MKLEVLVVIVAVAILLWWIVCRYQRKTREGLVRVLDSSADQSDHLDDFFQTLHQQGVGVKKVKVDDPENEKKIEGFRWRHRPWRHRHWWRYPFFYEPGYTYFPYWY